MFEDGGGVDDGDEAGGVELAVVRHVLLLCSIKENTPHIIS